MTGSGLCGVRMRDLGTTSIRRWRTRAMLKPETEPVSYCAVAMSAWFEKDRCEHKVRGAMSDSGLRGGNHDRDPQDHHQPRNNFLGTRRRGKSANYAGSGHGRDPQP